MTTSLSRRAVLAATATMAAAGSAAVPAFAAGDTPIASLWAKAEAAKLHLRAHASELSTIEALGGGLPGWMRASSGANAIGQDRYDALVAILDTAPRSAADLALMTKAASQPEIVHGPKGWAAARLDAARSTMAA